MKMEQSIEAIPLLNLAIASIPVVLGMFILVRWSVKSSTAIYAISRMLVQLLLIGYFLTYIFETNEFWIVLGVLAIMVFTSSWIALGTLGNKRLSLYKYAFISIFIGGTSTLVLITQGVLNLAPWYLPSYMVPLAGMIFANSMNSVSLSAERFDAEISRGVSYKEARNLALQTALIPIFNSLFAVGLVSLPGMMTGQILSGVSPLIAVRYQIMVMCMIFGSSVISSACFLTLMKSVYKK
jgi:putative ABC transport system permease protein